MLGKTSIKTLGLNRDMLEPCQFTINTSMGGSGKAARITPQPLLILLWHNDVMDATTIKIKAIII